jgi:hypothetical protein
MSFIGSALNRLGLYRPVRKTLQYLAEPARFANDWEIRQDLRQTRRDISTWAAEGGERADPNRLFVILSYTNLPLHAKFHALAAKTMQLHGYTPVVFTYTGCRFGHEYLRLFGIERLLMWNEYEQAYGQGTTELAAILAPLLPAKPTIPDILACSFHGVEVGKHALSVTSRKLIQGRLDITDPQTAQMVNYNLQRAVRAVLLAEKFLDEHPVEKMLVRDSGYIPNGSIYETALQRGVDCVVYEQGQQRHTWLLKRYTPETKSEHYFSLAPATWTAIQQETWTAKDDRQVETTFRQRYEPDSTDDRRRLQTGKKIKSPAAVREELQLDPARKTAVIFSHIAWDAAFFFGSCLFDDFEQWLFETVKYVAAECPHMNWLVKLHPFNVFKLQREDRAEESEMRLLRTLMPLPDHVKIVRAHTDINTWSLFPIADYVLTVNGTVGLEFPCYGVPVVVAGTGRYNGRGFTIEPQSREAYCTTLKTLHEVPRLGEATQQLARRHFLALITRRQFSLADVAPMELKAMDRATSDMHDNIQITARSLAEFAAAPSITQLGDWLADSDTPDLLQPR